MLISGKALLRHISELRVHLEPHTYVGRGKESHSFPFRFHTFLSVTAKIHVSEFPFLFEFLSLLRIEWAFFSLNFLLQHSIVGFVAFPVHFLFYPEMS